MVPLCVVELHQIDNSTRLGRVIVCDCRLEPFSLWRRLAQLAAKPAQERHGG
jgi:hypothetical protein